MQSFNTELSINLLAVLNHNPSPFPSQPLLFFLSTSKGRTPGALLLVGSNDASLHTDVPFGYASDGNKKCMGPSPNTYRIFHRRSCGVVGSTLAFGSTGHGFESENRLFSYHIASAFRNLRSLSKCSLDSVRRLI